MKASELIRRNYTDEEFNKLKNSNNTVRKSLGWHTPPVGRRESDPIVEIPKQEDYVSLRNTYNLSNRKNFWTYKSSIGCFGFVNTYVGEELEELEEVNPLYNKDEHSLWTELSDSFYQTAQDYKDGKIDYRFIWKWFQEQQNNYILEKI